MLPSVKYQAPGRKNHLIFSSLWAQKRTTTNSQKLDQEGYKLATSSTKQLAIAGGLVSDYLHIFEGCLLHSLAPCHLFAKNRVYMQCIYTVVIFSHQGHLRSVRERQRRICNRPKVHVNRPATIKASLPEMKHVGAEQAAYSST